MIWGWTKPSIGLFQLLVFAVGLQFLLPGEYLNSPIAEETVAQLQARIVAIEGGLTSSPSTAWYKYDTMDVVMKAIMTVATVIGLVAIDFI